MLNYEDAGIFGLVDERIAAPVLVSSTSKRVIAHSRGSLCPFSNDHFI